MTAAAGASAPFEDQDYQDYAFKMFPYTGTGSAREIELGYGMNLAGEGGLVWIKRRDGTGSQYMCDTESGVNKYHSPHTQTFQTSGGPVSEFTKTGFKLGGSTGNVSGEEYIAWVFRNKTGFFKVLKYTGTGSSQDVAHGLGGQIGMVWVHNMSAAKDMVCKHRGLPFSSGYINVNGAVAASNDSGNRFGTRFDDGYFNPTTDPDTNDSGDDYIAYCWAHDVDAFGASGNKESIIVCQNYNGNGSTDGPQETYDWQAQYLMFKSSESNGNWEIIDTTRGVSSIGSDKMLILRANGNGGEFEDNSTALINNGFKVHNPGGSNNSNGNRYIYMAIRKPDGRTNSTQHLTGDFAAANTACVHIGQSSASSTAPCFTTAMERPDLSIIKNYHGGTDHWWVGSRAMHYDKYIQLNANLPADHSLTEWDVWKGCHNSWNATNCGYIFNDCRSFDSIIYRGTGSTHYVRHGMGVAPSMVWCKNLESSDSIGAWHKHGMQGANKTGYYKLDQAIGLASSTSQYWGPPSEMEDHRWFRIDTSDLQVNQNGKYHIAMVFADVAGYTKSGGYSGTTSSEQTCGFSPRLIMVKGTHSDTNWMWFDTVRGIASGNDSAKALNSTDDETTNADWVDVSSTGWTPQGSSTHVNGSSKDYFWFAWA